MIEQNESYNRLDKRNHMKSIYINLKEEKNDAVLKQVGESVRKGEIILFPTETVYGIGANALDKNAVKKIYMAKGRQPDNPLIVHISDTRMLKELVEEPNETEQKLIDSFFPGPFTIILKRKKIIPNIITGGLDTVGIRMPSNLIAQKIIKYAGVPIAAPSANLSGKPSGTLLADIREEFEGKVSYMVDEGLAEIGVESTVVRVINQIPHILRPGKITAEQIKEKIGKVVIDEHILKKCDTEEVRSPGMKYRHYAPKTKCILVYSQNEQNLIEQINELIAKYKNVLVLGRTEHIQNYHTKNCIDIGNTKEEISKKIFTSLRKVDNFHVDLVIIEGVDKSGIGLAIMNRLIRACEYQYIEC